MTVIKFLTGIVSILRTYRKYILGMYGFSIKCPDDLFTDVVNEIDKFAVAGGFFDISKQTIRKELGKI